MLRIVTVLALAATAVLAPAAADAAVRYASPGGVTSSSNCTTIGFNPPCRIDRALNPAVTEDGDTVIIKTGTYDMTSTPAIIGETLTVHGEAGQPRPNLVDTNAGTPISIGPDATGTTLRHVEIAAQDVASGLALWVTAPATIEDVDLKGGHQCLLGTGPGITLENVTATLMFPTTGDCLGLSTASGVVMRNVHAMAPPTATSNPLAQVAGGSVIEDSTFETAGTGNGLAVNGFPASVVRRVRADGGSIGIVATGDVTVTDSIATSSAADGSAIRAYVAGPGGGLQLRNVTAVGSGAGSKGIAAAKGVLNGVAGEIGARNVIAVGAGADVYSEGAFDNGCWAPPCSSALIDIAASNYRTTGGTGGKSEGAGNQSGDPRFAGVEDFHLLDDSPAIDAGISDLLGPAAFDGAARVLGNGPDMGAYERARAAAPETPAGGGDTTPAGGDAAPDGSPPSAQPAATDRTAPTLSQAVLARKRVRRGRALRLALVSSEAGALEAKVVRVLRGGKRRTARVLNAALAEGAGLHVLRPGRLRAGRYRLALVARDVAGNASAVTQLTFRVRR